MKRDIVELIYGKRELAGILTSRGRDTTKVDDELAELWKKYPKEYSEAQRQLYADYA